MSNNNSLFSWIGNTCAVVLTAVQTNQIFQVISLVLTILSILTSLAYTIYKWYKQAKSDGKITPDEIKEIIKEGGETAKEIIDVINDYNVSNKTDDKKGDN